MATVALPTGFVEQRTGKTLWWLKVGWELILPDLIPHDLAEQSSHSSLIIHHSSLIIPGGRGTIQRIEINPQEALIVRRYHRGGLVRHFVRDLYWDRPLRPFAELCCTEEARRRGVSTVEVLGAQVEWTMGPLYRGLLVTREATGFHNLWDWLQTAPTTDLRWATLNTVAQVIATMHRAGITHADLNPTNILVCTDSDPPQALIIDFDRARLFSGLVPLRLREANLRRLQRFFGNYDVLQEWLPPAEFEQFRQVYYVALAVKKIEM